MDILLVEDRDEDAELTKLAFEASDYDVSLHRERDGEQALEWLFKEQNRQEIKNLKLILLDINLPKLNGLETLKRIKSSELKYIPVVMLTTSSERSDIEEAYNNHANGYTLKPVRYEDFQVFVEGLSRYWINMNINV